MPTWADKVGARIQPASQFAGDIMPLVNVGVAVLPHAKEPAKKFWKFMKERDERIHAEQRERWARKAEEKERRRRRRRGSY